MEIDYEEYGKIICAALLHNNCIYMSKKGHHVLFSMKPKGVLRNAIQGFVTENGYFVDRKLGLSIANYYNQIDTKNLPMDELLKKKKKKENIKVLKLVKEYTYKENNV